MFRGLVICAFIGSSYAVSGHACTDNRAELEEDFSSLYSKAELLGEELAALQKAGVPHNDPKSIKIAAPLGEALGTLYGWCVCKEELSQTKQCIELKKAFEKEML